jgi:hypothetical protein
VGKGKGLGQEGQNVRRRSGNLNGFVFEVSTFSGVFGCFLKIVKEKKKGNIIA